MKINKELCGLCFGCASVCPIDALVADDKEIIVTEICNNCGVCAKICPIGAIKIDET